MITRKCSDDCGRFTVALTSDTHPSIPLKITLVVSRSPTRAKLGMLSSHISKQKNNLLRLPWLSSDSPWQNNLWSWLSHSSIFFTYFWVTLINKTNFILLICLSFTWFGRTGGNERAVLWACMLVRPVDTFKDVMGQRQPKISQQSSN